MKPVYLIFPTDVITKQVGTYDEGSVYATKSLEGILQIVEDFCGGITGSKAQKQLDSLTILKFVDNKYTPIKLDVEITVKEVLV